MSYFEKNTYPFTWRVTPDIPLNFKIPNNIKSYDGTTDPDDHLFVFTKTLGIYYQLSEFKRCELFPLTLRGTARMWFMALPPESISNFAQLAKSFRTAFLHKVKFQKSREEIMQMKPQGFQESLKEFVERFNDDILETETGERLKDDFEKLAVSVFINGLQPGPCLNDFRATPPTTLADLLVRANQFRA
ncbi:gag protein [Tanacetum coccineum]